MKAEKDKFTSINFRTNLDIEQFEKFADFLFWLNKDRVKKKYTRARQIHINSKSKTKI